MSGFIVESWLVAAKDCRYFDKDGRFRFNCSEIKRITVHDVKFFFITMAKLDKDFREKLLLDLNANYA